MAEPAAAVRSSVAARAPARAQQRQGMLLFLGALLAFACYDAFAKQMLYHYPATLMNLSRYIAVCSMAAVLLWRHGDWRVWRQPHQRLLLLRSLMLAIVATSFMTALASMPLAEATAIYFTAPLIMVALSPWVLGEPVGRVQWVAVLVGFAGMLLIVRPGGTLPLAGSLLMGLSAVCYALFQVLTRRLSGLVPAPVQYAYMAAVCLVVTNLPTLFGAPIAWPGGLEMLGLVAGGFVSGAAQLLLLAAFRRVSASILAPMNYLQLALAVLISTFWFQRPPDALGLGGMALIGAAGVYLALPRSVK